MTIKNAITHLAHKIIGCKTTGESWADCVSVDALEMATTALEKQEPQRVIQPEYEYICECPSCGCSVLDCNYCRYCGQKLDWNAIVKRGEREKK